MMSLVCDIVREAGSLAMLSRHRARAQNKQDGTWVTDADRAVERLIRDRLINAFPAVPVHGEEFGGADLGTHQRIWAVDPIDGTGNYVTGLPAYGVSIALLESGRPVLGVVYLPELDVLFQAERGRGALMNGSAIHGSPRQTLGTNSLVGVNSEAVARLAPVLPGKLRNLGSMAAHGCYVASGGLDAAIFHRWHAWDIAAALCVAWETGAEARLAATGEPLLSMERPCLEGDDTLVIGHPHIVRALLDLPLPGARN
ncbi:MAG: inositol monophosphatase [Armatimonadetes bacterium]|nr:inositol monophosphatase [Armatimonadota bacterium]